MRTSIRGARIWVSALVLIGTHAQAIASCDISGSNVMFQGIEKRDGPLAGTSTLNPVTQKPAQSKAQPQQAPPTASTPPR